MTDPSSLFDLSGKVAVVTGGTRGIGEMIATGFVKAGVKVYVTSRKGDACTAMQTKLSKLGDCVGHPSDLSTIAGVSAFAKWLGEREDKVDILVNNAGAAWGEPIEKFSEAGWDRVMDLNVKSLFFMTQKLLPQLRAAAGATGRGRVINIGSIEGFTMPMAPGNFAYPASKAAVHHLTRSLARELAADKITVNAISPGPFESKMTAYAMGTEEGKKQVAAMVPLGRIGADSDMIGLSTFLASAASDYVTGVSIPLDGGYVNLR
jgi:NAD(P)-dependent dehydrogenase (short-subunit alcohol dehydrogenase family)